MKFRATTDAAGRMTIVVLFLTGHEPIHLEPDQAAELAKLIGDAGKQAAAERRAGPAPTPERRKAAATA